MTTIRRYRLSTDLKWSQAVALESETGSTPMELDGKIPGVYPWAAVWSPPEGPGNYADVACKEKFPNSTIIEGYRDNFPTIAPLGSFAANQFGL